jgi:tetratricopeptide (TPR) repeat protein/outer membrane biosynthesis protein TonB
MSWRNIIGLWVLLIGFMASGLAYGEQISVRAGTHDGYARLVFKWSVPVQYTAKIENGALNLNFGEPAQTSYAEVRNNLKGFVTSVNEAQGGRQVSMALTNPNYGLRSFYTGSYLVVDILGEPNRSQAAAPAPAPASRPQAQPAPQVQPVAPRPQPVAQAAPVATAPQASVVPTSGPTVRVRKGEKGSYTRIVFDWPRKVGYQVGDYAGKTIIDFNEPAKYNFGPASRNLTGQVRGLRQNGKAVELDVSNGARIKHFYVGSKVVVDVYRDNITGKPQAPAMAVAQAQPAPQPATAPTPVAAPTPAPAPSEPPKPVAAPVQQVAAPKPLPAPEPETAPSQPALAAAFSLRFEFGEPVAAAAFRRSGSVWLVFDKQTQQDLNALKAASNGTILNIEQLPIPRATVLRLETVAGFNPRPKREGLAWVFEFGKIPLLALQEIEVQPQPHSPAGSRLFMSVQEGGLPVPFQDPIVGDNLVVVPVIPLGHGVNTKRTYPQFELLASAQGAVYRPLSDDLRIRTLKSGIEMTAKSSLKLSETGKKALAQAKMGGLRGVSRMFDFDKWALDGTENFRETRQELEKSVAGLKGPRREIAREALAKYYLSHARGPEALGVIDVMAKADPTRVQDPDFKALRGVANFITYRLDEAKEDLTGEEIAAKDEGAFWQAAVDAAMGDYSESAFDLKRLGGVIRNYPPRLKFPLALVLTEAALSTGDVRQAESYLEVLEAEGLDPRKADAVKYLRGKTKEISGDPDGAVVVYEDVELGNHRPSRARAALAKNELLYKHERITDKELIEALEKLRFAWRGDDFEFNLLRRLGDLYNQTLNYRDGLRTMRQAATYFREHPNAEEVTQEMIRIFEELYLDGKADELAPVTAIALYDEFRELTPAGEKGDEMIRKLADRLAAVDLLREAAELLENQVQFRLSGEKKSQVGTRLAVVYLAAGNPKRAIRALQKSSRRNMSAEEIVQRRHLEARALIDMGEADKAMAMLDNVEDETMEADLLRAEVYWNAGDWRNSAGTLKRLAVAKGVKRNKPLSEDQARLVLNLAVSYTLGANERGVARVRADYGGAMEATTLRDAFRLIASRENAGMLDPRTITQLVKPAENFTTFMSEYNARLKAGELSAIN